MKKITIFCFALIILIGSLCFSATAKTADAVAVIPDYEVMIDDASVYYYDSLYPFLNYKDITYLPMTWRFAVDEFGWDYSFTNEEGLIINSK